MAGLVEGKAGLVTGAAGGIGRATALLFAKEGAKVMVSDWNEEEGKKTVDLIRAKGGVAEFFKCDVSNEEQVKELVKATVDTFGKLDFAHNNAAITAPNGAIGEMDFERGLDRVLKINLYGAFYCMKHEINVMVEQGGGSIVNTTSTAGFTGGRNISGYNASKFGVCGATRCAAMEYGKNGIRVNAIAPGMTLTPMIEDFYNRNPEYFKQLEGEIPLGEIAKPEDQAEPVVWLCSDRARMITGVIIPVDGGATTGY